MPEDGIDTYTRLLEHYVGQGIIKRDEAILVQFAGGYDERVCADVGLTDCTFSNIAPESQSTTKSGPTTAVQFDAHRMPQPDLTFDHVVGHAGLHHCSRPHEALHEMYRLAKKTVLFVENQDSAMMRAATAAGIVTWYESGAVVAGGYATGGVDGTGVPNHVYRWTRREVQKAVASFDPGHAVPIEFHTEWNVDASRTASLSLARKLKLQPAQAERLLRAVRGGLNGFLARQGNIFAAMIRKDLAVLQPWMESSHSLRRC